MDGILNIKKPQGMTSFGVVALIKRLTGERHTGHAGTLDPEATGVLPVCLGQATRVIEYLFDETKTYQTEVEFGITTDTYDSTGKVISTGDTAGITRETIESALSSFRGSIMQTPPMYSAIKHHGQPLYKLARSGINVERRSRAAQIFSLEIIAWRSPVVTLKVVCGKGTYIRSLAHDLGKTLGGGAVMKSLVRLRVGPFGIEEALSVPQLEQIALYGGWQQHLYPLDFVLLDFPALIVKKKQQCLLVHGSAITIESDIITDTRSGCLSRVYTEDGSFLGMARYDQDNKRWQPQKIFLKKCCELQES
jgi:tRNA pseudouridine55 synthase